MFLNLFENLYSIYDYILSDKEREILHKVFDRNNISGDEVQEAEMLVKNAMLKKENGIYSLNGKLLKMLVEDKKKHYELLKKRSL